MLGNFNGWHALVTLGVSGLLVAGIVVLIVFVVRASSKSRPGTLGPAAPAAASSPATPGTVQRLTELDELRSRGLLTDDEYEAKRAEILRDL